MDDSCKRKGDFKIGFGPVSFEGRGISVLTGILAASVMAMAAALFIHQTDTAQLAKHIANMDQGQRLLACIVSVDPPNEREAQLENPNSKCRRFAKGDL